MINEKILKEELENIPEDARTSIIYEAAKAVPDLLNKNSQLVFFLDAQRLRSAQLENNIGKLVAEIDHLKKLIYKPREETGLVAGEQ